MILIILAAFLNAVATFIADRSDWLKKNPYILGLFFGLTAILLHHCRIEYLMPGVIISLVDVPSMTAAFFFGPVPGLIAGGTITVYRLFNLLFLGATYGYISAVASLGVAIFAAATSRYFFIEKRPAILPAAICMAFGSIQHLLYFLLVDIHESTSPIDIITCASLFVIPGTLLGSVLVSIACREWGTLSSNLLNRTMLIFLLFDLACGGIFAATQKFAMKQMERTTAQSYIALRESFLEQLRYMLRDSSVSFLDMLPDIRYYSDKQLQELAKKFRFDEINIYNRDGTLAASSSSTVRNSRKKLNFRSPNDGPLTTIRFMETGFDAKFLAPENVFRVSRPFPDGSGYLELGIDEKVCLLHMDTMILPLLKNHQVGDNGYFIVIDHLGTIQLPSSKQDDILGKNVQDFGISDEVLAKPDRVCSVVRFDGEWCCIGKVSSVTGWAIISVLPLGDVCNSYFSLASICCLALLLLLFTARAILLRLRLAWARIEALRQEKVERHKREMEMARNIQMDELRTDTPENKYFRVESFIRPAEEVGGDFYDYFHLQNNIPILVIGDVSGEGIPAALFMMKTKTAIRENVRTSSSLTEAMTKVNQYLCRHNTMSMFVTVWIGALDLATGIGEYICAGHNPPFWTHIGREPEFFPGTPSMALGVSPSAQYKSTRVQLKHGDRVFLYTDGVTEAKNHSGAMFSVKRIKKILATGPDNHIAKIYAALQKFTHGYPQSDDITMLELQFRSSDAEIQGVKCVEPELAPIRLNQEFSA